MVWIRDLIASIVKKKELYVVRRSGDRIQTSFQEEHLQEIDATIITSVEESINETADEEVITEEVIQSVLE